MLSKLLPIVIGKLGAGASPALQKKVLEILSHVNKRGRALPALRLPLHELAALYSAPGSGAMARNFAIVYMEQAVARAPPTDRFAEASAAAAPPVGCLRCWPWGLLMSFSRLPPS